MSPAPNSTRNASQRKARSTGQGGAIASLPRKIARKPASSSSVSQPNPYHVPPMFTIDW